MNAPLEQRLDELEVKLTFIDDTVHALAAADADQSQRIAALERRRARRAATAALLMTD
jgi:SlyX protein